MNNGIINIIQQFREAAIIPERKATLLPLAEYIAGLAKSKQQINLNFICTHNSRRSHLSQIWAQTMAWYFGIPGVYCYSGGTEATAMFPMIATTLEKQGFKIWKLSEDNNPVYAVKFADTQHPIICFSKPYHDAFNPTSQFAAVVTCNSANEACPVVLGAAARFSVMYLDPKAFDGTPQMEEKYTERSLQIAEEFWYVFSQVKAALSN